jgi:hypothetical protein
MKNTLLISVIFFALLLTGQTSLNAQEQLTNLPTVYIDTDNRQQVTDKVTWVPAKITVKSSIASEEITDVLTEIRGRGNSTWSMNKKPYRIKLDKKANMLGLPAKAKNWVLLANYIDKTLIRNAVAFKISEMAGLEFSSSVKFIDLVFNGEFVGNYMVTDQMEVDENRVNVEKQATTDTTEPSISGGYLLEIDGFAAGEEVWFTTPQALKVTVKYPKDDEINNEQLSYITDWTANFENVLFSTDYKNPDTGYRTLVDTASLINWYIACELTGNSDSFWSTYIYKRRNINNFFFGPMWDYDIAFNNDKRLGDAVHKLMRNAAHNPRTWIQRIWSDEWFQQAVARRWQQLLDAGIENQVITYINDTETLLDASQDRNFQKWNILNTQVYQETFLFPTYEEGVGFLRQYIKDRVAFLTNSFIIPEPEKPTEAFVAENFYYRILNRRTNNAIDVSGESLVLWEPAEDDDGQLWKIEPLGGDLFRFINKQSGLVMTANGRGNNLLQKDENTGNTNQKWQLVPLFTGGIYGIVNPSSGYSVNNNGGAFTNGTPVIEWENNISQDSKSNQHWFLNKAEEIKSLPTDLCPVRENTCYAKNRIIYYNNLYEGSLLKLYDMQGRLAAEKKSASGSGEWATGRQGIYILKIIGANNIQTIKIIL